MSQRAVDQCVSALGASTGNLGSDHVPSPQQLRQQERHEEKLRDIRDQVAQGKLVIRKMTAAERKRFPPREGGRTRKNPKRP
jgi:hypothetical protein